MPLQSSGQISLNDIHVEAGGTTSTEATVNDTDIRSLISASSQQSNLSFNQFYGASNTPPGDIAVGDKFVFTSCKMMGAFGPYNDMLQPYYASQGYNSTFTNQFQPMQFAGIQRWKFPEAGTYKFVLCGAWAGHGVDQGYDHRDGANYYDTNSITYTDGYSGWQSDQNQYSNMHLYGNPGKLTVYKSVSTGDIMDIMIGQRGLAMQYGNTNTPTSNVCAPGGGATVVAFNQGNTTGMNYGTSNYNAGDVAIAGGAGANRNNYQYAYTGRNSAYQINGLDGDASGGDGGQDGYGGTDPATSYRYYDYTSGAGWRGDGSEHTDDRTNTSYNGSNIKLLEGRAQSLFDQIYPGQGAISSPVWSKPFYYNSYQRGSFYIGINSSHLVNEFGEKQNSSSSSQWNMYQSRIETWGTTLSTNKKDFSQLAGLGITTLDGNGRRIGTYPISTYMGGFGGGSVGCYGGAGGGGGWSGGGAGRYYYSGAGSSYKVGFDDSSYGTSYQFSSPYSNSNDAHWNYKYANCSHFGISSDTSIKTGLLRGNGWLQVERVG